MTNIHDRITVQPRSVIPFPDDLDDEDPVERRLVLLLCLDTSGSMRGRSIQEVNDKLGTWFAELRRNPYYARALEVALVTFGEGGVCAWRGPERVAYRDAGPGTFVPLSEFRPPQLRADGNTPMGEALRRSIDLIDQRKKFLRRHAEQVYRPLLWLVTDGAPTDPWEPLIQRIADAERNGHLQLHAVGVGAGASGERRRVLEALSPARNYELNVNIEGLLARMTDSIDQVRGRDQTTNWRRRP
ncbi:VWA domain-containing protein [Frankia sp. AgB32]|uniref:vWA domain-containing protein n=1 Tax=Frankia sp. AgB32 TaxID=631119 RepID=UPI002010C0EC|nr:VWA domain-containing protein [Frankia sp. AgB32]MCK9895279.1 VWA domain-containing protein [Frankia sp. AgB32]